MGLYMSSIGLCTNCLSICSDLPKLFILGYFFWMALIGRIFRDYSCLIEF